MRSCSVLLVWGALLGLLVSCSSGGTGSDSDVPLEDVVLDGTAPGLDVADLQEEVAVPIDWDAVFSSTDWQSDGKRRVVILHTNDLHSHLNGGGPLADFSPTVLNNDATYGGFARLATLLEQHRRDLRPDAGLLIVDAGDFSFGTAFASLAKQASVELQAMAAMGYHATTVGNHELDWSPEGLTEVLTEGIELDGDFRVLASNLVFSAEDTADDSLEALMGDQLLPWKVVELENGVKIGMFGLLGVGAHKLAPHAEPVTVTPLAEAAQKMVTLLRDQEGVDLVVALSHSGVTEGDIKGEDEQLAKDVDGIDVVVSGHTHTLLPEPTLINDTIVVQVGSFGLFLGELVLVESEGTFQLESWTARPVDDSIPGWPAMLDMIAGWEAMLDDGILKNQEWGYRATVATTGFDLMAVEFSESNLGDLVADAVRWGVSQYAGPVDVAFEANGVIREGIHQGATGAITTGDIIRVLSIGLGPDGEFSYPMLSLYLTPYELKLAAEVICGIAPIFANSFFLQISGMRFEYEPEGDLFKQVQTIYLGNDIDGYATESLDLSPENKTLYHVAVNLYIGQMLSVLKGMTGGALAIEPKDADGNVVEDLEKFLVDLDPDTAGMQELKLWRTLYEYLSSLEKGPGADVPAIPGRYETVSDRIHALP